MLQPEHGVLWFEHNRQRERYGYESHRKTDSLPGFAEPASFHGQSVDFTGPAPFLESRKETA